MYDFVVVGTGPSSFFLVKTLLKKIGTKKVAVLEAGMTVIDNEHLLSNKQSICQDFKLKPTINIGFGGTSQLWHNVLAPLDAEDFTQKDWVPMSGWPISLDELTPHYHCVSNFFDFDYEVFYQPQSYIDFDYEIDKVNIDKKVFKHKVFVHPLKYLRTNVNFADLEKRHDNLDIIHGAVALRFDMDKGHTKHLEYYDLSSKQTKRIYAKQYVLCAGALNNPEILLNSGNLRHALPMLGKCLMDHPMGNFFQFRYEKSVDAKIYSGMQLKEKINIKTALTLTPEIQKSEQLANSAFYLRPSFAEGFGDKTEELKLKLLTVRNKLKRFQLPFREMIQLTSNINMAAQIVQYKTGLFSKHSLTDCMFVTEQRPNLNSEVCLTDKKNKYGNYEVSIKWQLQNQDISDVYNHFGFINSHIMNRNNAKETYDHTEYNWVERLSSAAHHLGTVRMSEDAETGCVDKNLKLHNIDNVYICDGSVFTTSGNANPTFTCMALAHRLGEYLSDA